MRITLRSWPEKIEVASKRNYFNPVDHEIVKFHRADDAMHWLRPHLANHVLMKDLRLLLVSEKIPHVESMNHQQVCQFVATQLFQNKFVLAKTLLLKHESVVIVVEEAPAPIEAPKSKAEPAPPPEAPRPAPAPEPVDNTDYEAQAATLVAAAENGTPFCEECEKAKKKREQRNAA